jgi:hypothetical protein
MAPINCRRVSGCRRWVSRGRSAVAGGGWEGVHPTSLTYWRRRLARSDRPSRIFDAVRQVVAETGALAGKTRRALDSTVLDDAVATQDTVTQLIAAIRRAAREVPDAVRTPTGAPIRALPGRRPAAESLRRPSIGCRHRRDPRHGLGRSDVLSALLRLTAPTTTESNTGACRAR